MGMKRIYTCNICSYTIEDPVKSFGLCFDSSHNFTLGGYGCTEFIHICYRCALQLKEHLDGAEIDKILQEFKNN